MIREPEIEGHSAARSAGRTLKLTGNYGAQAQALIRQ
jgi:hypothetical protein